MDTKAVIAAARKVSAESYVARFKAQSIAGWAILLRRQSAEFRQNYLTVTRARQ